jgi:hypothetical protein
MIQVQSSWFPLYDRNPQTFVTNIFFAAPQDYAKAVQRIYHVTSASSFIDLPVVPMRYPSRRFGRIPFAAPPFLLPTFCSSLMAHSLR